MNREDRRKDGEKVKELVRKSTGYVLTALVDGRVMMFADVSSLTDNEDIRHRVMNSMFDEQKELVAGVNQAHAKITAEREEADRVQKAKEARSALAASFGGTEIKAIADAPDGVTSGVGRVASGPVLI